MKRPRPWLLPLVPFYAAGVALRHWRIETGREQIDRLRWPVISIGNLSAGGTGKTPFTIAISRLLMTQGFHVDVLSRGYGRISDTVERVDPDGCADRFGDEPLLIARETSASVYVARRRYQAGLLAESEAEHIGIQAGIHLLDDGLQHRQLHRDVDILLLNSEDWFEGRLLPAGNLRESRQSGLRRATILAVPTEGPDTNSDLEFDLRRKIPIDRNTEAQLWPGPLWRFRRHMDIPQQLLQAGSVAAFCGIARPSQFFKGLEAGGLRLAVCHTFSDHHPFRSTDLTLLLDKLRLTKASAFVTTDKDLVRLGPLAAQLEQVAPLFTVGLRITLDDEASIATWLRQRLSL